MLRRPETIGRYQVRERLATGGFATVYRAHDPMLDRAVALKLLHPHLADDAETRERFVREGRALARVHHPNVVQVFDAGEADGTAYLAMELVEGQPLHAIIAERGGLPLAEVLPIVDGVAAALTALHRRNLIHRDVKPANILIEAETGRVVLLDLGVARSLDSATVTTARWLVGTPGFMAPEQIDPHGAPSPRTDVYQFAATVYALLAGRPPFEGESTRVLYAIMHTPPPSLQDARPDLPPPVVAVVAGALSKEPDARPRGALAFAAELRTAAADVAEEPAKTALALPVADHAHHQAPPLPSDPRLSAADEPPPSPWNGSNAAPAVGASDAAPSMGSGSTPDPWAPAADPPVDIVPHLVDDSPLHMLTPPPDLGGAVVAPGERTLVAARPARRFPAAALVGGVLLGIVALAGIAIMRGRGASAPDVADRTPTTAASEPRAAVPPALGVVPTAATRTSAASVTAVTGAGAGAVPPPPSPAPAAPPTQTPTPPPPTPSPATTRTAAPAPGGKAAALLRAAMEGEGYAPVGRVVQSPPTSDGDVVSAQRAVCSGAGNDGCQKVFILWNDRYLGTDWSENSRRILDVGTPGPGQISVTYAAWAAGDPPCCPSLAPVTVVYVCTPARCFANAIPPGLSPLG